LEEKRIVGARLQRQQRDNTKDTAARQDELYNLD